MSRSRRPTSRGSVKRGVVLRLPRRQRSAQVATRIAFCARRRDGVAEDLAAVLLHAVRRFDRSTRLDAPKSSRRSAGRIDAIGFLPIQGKTSRSRRRMIFSECVAAQFGAFFSYHSRATSSNESAGGRPASARRSSSRFRSLAFFAALRRSLGSMPLRTCWRASSAFLRARLKRRRRVGAEAQRLATSVERVVEPPAVRAALDEQQQVEPVAIVQARCDRRLP